MRRPKPLAVLGLSAAPQSRVQVVSWLFPAPVPAASKPAAAAPVVAPYRQAQRHSACAQNLRRRGPDSGRRLPDRQPDDRTAAPYAPLPHLCCLRGEPRRAGWQQRRRAGADRCACPAGRAVLLSAPRMVVWTPGRHLRLHAAARRADSSDSSHALGSTAQPRQSVDWSRPRPWLAPWMLSRHRLHSQASARVSDARSTSRNPRQRGSASR